MAKRTTAVEVQETKPVQKFDFNVWYTLREKRIPAQHLREIVWADFQARGLTKFETLETYDAALASYGVRL